MARNLKRGVRQKERAKERAVIYNHLSPNSEKNLFVRGQRSSKVDNSTKK
jgi:hypothetical protein